MGIKPEKEQSDIENAVLENYNKTVKFKNNVYEVQLPWNERVFELMDNYDLARKRLYSLNKKFEKCPEFEIDYLNVGKSKRKYKLPPKAEIFVEVQSKGKQKQSELVLITPTKHSFDSNWTVSNSVNKFNDTGNYWVKLANFSDSVVYINKGTKLVNIEEVEGLKLQNNNVNSIEVSQIDKDFDLFGGQFDLKHLNEEQKQQMLNLIHKHKNIFAD